MQCVVLSGGLGTRMRPYTTEMPKALIPVGGIPFVDLQLAWLASHGVTEVVLSIGHLGGMIRERVGDGARWGLPVRYVDEGTDLRGTGGALRKALDEGALAPSFLVTYGDSFLPIDFRAVGEAFLASGLPAAMTVLANAGRWDASNVVWEKGRLVVYDKKRASRPAADFQHIDYGLTALQRAVVKERVPPGERCDLADLFFALSQEGKLLGVEVFERFYEIGSPEGLADFEAWLAEQKKADEAAEGGEPAWARGAV